MNMLWNEFRRVLLSAVAGIAFLGAFTVFSHADPIRLTDASVKQFIASFPAVKAVAVRYAVSKGMKIASGKDAMVAVLSVIGDDTIKPDVEAAVKPYGFEDIKEWMGVAKSVSLTYAHLKLSPEDLKKRQKIEKTIAKIEKNDFLPKKTKKQMIEAAREGLDLVENPPAENVEAVKPRIAEIDAVVKK
jgi:hypothetical protein